MHILAMLLLGAWSLLASAAEITVYCPGAVRSVVLEIAGMFKRETRHEVKFVFGTTGGLQKRVASGAPGDVVISTAEGVDALSRLGPVVAESSAELGAVGVGVGARAGAALPNIATPETFRQAMLEARSVLFADPALGGQSGMHAARIFEQLGITEAMQPKIVLVPNFPDGLARIASGQIELGIGPMSELRTAKGISVAGALPPALQSLQTFAAGLMRASASPAVARGFIEYLTASRGRARFLTAGFEVPQ